MAKGSYQTLMRDGEGGSILIVTMWVVFAIVGLALVFARSARLELSGSVNFSATVQVETAARGALAWLLAELAGVAGEDEESLMMAGGAPGRIGNVDFWILPPGASQNHYDPGGGGDGFFNGGRFFVVRDEGGYINLNQAGADLLSALPGGGEELAEAVVAWRGGEADIADSGFDDYLRLPEPYQRKQGPLETVEELLLVKGVTAEWLYGEQYHRDGYQGAAAFTGWGAVGARGFSGLSEFPLFDYITVFSRSAPAAASGGGDREGEERLEVNQAGSSALRQLLRPWLADEQLGETVTRLRSGQPFANIIDFYYQTGLSLENFAEIINQITVGGPGSNAGLLNINTAPRHVLLCLPGIGESEATALIEGRGSAADRGNLLWITEVLSQEQAVALANLATTRSYHFSAEIVAVDQDRRVFRRYRVVIDTAGRLPQVVYWKDLSHWGFPEGLLGQTRIGL